MEESHNCMNCRWCKILEDSQEKNVWLCLNRKSPSCLDVIGPLWSCDEWADEKEEEV